MLQTQHQPSPPGPSTPQRTPVSLLQSLTPLPSPFTVNGRAGAGAGRFGHQKSGELTGCNWFSLGLTRFDCGTACGIEVLRCFKE